MGIYVAEQHGDINLFFFLQIQMIETATTADMLRIILFKEKYKPLKILTFTQFTHGPML